MTIQLETLGTEKCSPKDSQLVVEAPKVRVSEGSTNVSESKKRVLLRGNGPSMVQRVKVLTL